MHNQGKAKEVRRHRQGGRLASDWLRQALWGARRWTAVGLLAASLTGAAWANPSGGQVKHGTVNITPGLEMQIQQLTDKAIVDWQSFSIGAGEAVRILQPGQLSVILNRVVGVDPSTILGRLEANGNVFLINPNGILFGPGSVVNVGGLVASTLSISDENFLAGQYSFVQDPNEELAAVVNQGTIRITDGGYAVLCAPGVINEGTIIARTGKVALAAGERSTLNLDGRDLVHYTLDGEVSQGSILLAPGMMSDALAATLGVPEARRADHLVRLPDGSVRLERSSGTLVQAGTISADGAPGVDAGKVILDSADLTLVGSGSVTTASGEGFDSDGGEVLLLSEMNSDHRDRGASLFMEGAFVAARGGSTGDGGVVELSGDRIALKSHPDLRAPSGDNGRFLLDPPGMRIVSGVADGMTTNMGVTLIGADFIETQLATGDFEVFSTTDLLSLMDPLDSIQDSTPGSRLTLTAATNIDLGDDIYNVSELYLDAGGDIDIGTASLTANGEVNLAASNIRLGSSTITSTVSGLNAVATETIDLGTANITVGDDTTFQTTTVNPASDITAADATIISNGGLLSVLSGGDVNLGTSDITADTLVINAQGDVVLGTSATTPMTITINNGGDLAINSATANVSLGNSTTTSQGNTTFAVPNGNLDIGTSTLAAGQAVVGVTIPAFIAADVEGQIVGQGSLAADRILLFRDPLAGTTDRISINVNSNLVRPRLAAHAAGDVFISDIGFAGLILVRQSDSDNLGGPGSTGSITSDTGFIQLNTGGPMDFGIAQFIGGPGSDLGASLVAILNGATPANRRIVLFASRFNDTNNDPGPSGVIEVSNPVGLVRLRATGLGANGGLGTAALPIDIDAQGLEAIASTGGNVFVNRTNAGPLTSLAFFVDNADLAYTAAGSTISYQGATGLLNFLGATPIDAANLVFVANHGNLLVQNFLVGPNQQVELKALAGTILDAVPGNSVTVQGNGRLALVGQNGIGSAVDPFSISGGAVALSSNLGSIFLDSAGTLLVTTMTIPPVLGDPLGSTITGASAPTGSVALSNATGDISAISPITAGAGSVIVDSQGKLATAAVSATSSVLLDAGDTIRTTGLVQAGANIDVLAGNEVVLDGALSSLTGNVLVDSGTGAIIANQTIQANNGDVVLDAGTGLAVNAPTTARGTVLLSAGGAITQGATGLTTSGALGVRAGTGIGAAGDEFEFNAETLALSASGNSFLRDLTGDLTLSPSVNAGATTVTTGPVTGSLTLLTNEGTLTIASDLSVTADLILGAGTTSGTASSALNLNNSVGVGGGAVLDSAGNIVLGATLTAGDNAVLRAGANIDQRLGATLQAQALGLSAGGDLVSANGGDLMIRTNQLALDVDGNAFVRQASGDLQLIGSVQAAGTTQAGGTVGGDMRVRVDDGQLTVSAPYQAQNLALVTGTSLVGTVNQVRPARADIVLDENLVARNNMVVLSAGGISQTSGTLTSPNLGLGASGPIGTSTRPLNIATDNISVNQSTPFLADADGFATTPQVTASSVTVNNQLVLPRTPTPTPPIPVPPTTNPLTPTPPTSNPENPTVSDVDVPSSVDLDPQGRLPEALSGNRVDRIEQAIDEVLFGDDLLDQEPVLEWWENEELLRKKRRI
jgi:filamentous hemagglutinin family protein